MLNTIAIAILLTSSSCKNAPQEQSTENLHTSEKVEVLESSRTDDTILSTYPETEVKQEVRDEVKESKEVKNEVEEVTQEMDKVIEEKTEVIVEDATVNHNPVQEEIKKEEEIIVEEAEKIEDSSEEAVDKVEEVKKEEVIEEKPALPVAMDHSSFDQLLRTYVSSSGVVNYSGLKGKEATLDAYLVKLGENVPSSSEARNARLAYWINAYNAYTIKLILKNLPLKSITDLHGGKPWDKKWIELGGKTYSLNQIEHEIIRPRFKDPRIHFAVNCAATSCPPIPNKAFTSANLNSLLNQRTKAFINNTAYNKVSGASASLSKIFDWYGEDFGDLITYINKYSKVKVAAGSEVKFLEYDWALNGK